MAWEGCNSVTRLQTQLLICVAAISDARIGNIHTCLRSMRWFIPSIDGIYSHLNELRDMEYLIKEAREIPLYNGKAVRWTYRLTDKGREAVRGKG